MATRRNAIGGAAFAAVSTLALPGSGLAQSGRPGILGAAEIAEQALIHGLPMIHGLPIMMNDAVM